MKAIKHKFLLLIMMSFANFAYCQTQPLDSIKNDFGAILLKSQWVSDHILGLDPKVETYKLTKYTPIGKFSGNMTQFLDSVNFHSEYYAWCDNDYFTAVSGKYQMIAIDKIAIIVETVSYSGEWAKPTEHREVSQLIYKITVVNEAIILTKE